MIERWSVHPSIPIGLAILALAYAAGIARLARREGSVPRIYRLQAATFALGLVIFFLALTGPIHDLSDSYLFSAHMVQHLIVTLVAPPLVLLGTPGWLLEPLLRPPAVRGVVRFLTRAPVAFVLFSVTLAVWHLPVLYNATLLLLEVHIFEHLLFIGTAFIAWWPVLSPIREMRLRPLLQVLYLILLTLPMKGLGALLTLSDELLFPAYALAPRVFGIDAFEDQRIGGLLMWVPAGFILWGAATIVFFRWWFSEERSEASASAASKSAQARTA
jgi:putative membrane protein